MFNEAISPRIMRRLTISLCNARRARYGTRCGLQMPVLVEAFVLASPQTKAEQPQASDAVATHSR